MPFFLSMATPIFGHAHFSALRARRNFLNGHFNPNIVMFGVKIGVFGHEKSNGDVIFTIRSNPRPLAIMGTSLKLVR